MVLFAQTCFKAFENNRFNVDRLTEKRCAVFSLFSVVKKPRKKVNLMASRVNLIMIVVSSLPLALTMSRLFLVSKN